MQKATYSLAETTELLSLGRSTVYELVDNGELPPIKFGRKTLFAATDIVKLLDRRRKPIERI